MLTVMNMYGSASFEQRVLGENTQSEEEIRRFEEKKVEKQRLEEERQEKVKRQLEEKHKIEAERLRLKYEKEQDAVVKRIEIDKKKVPIQKEVEKELIEDIESGLAQVKEVEIATEESELELKRQKIKARTGFPLTIDVATNQLIVTRPDGTTKAVSVLPDQAVSNFIRHKKVDLINFEEPPIGSGSGETDNTGTGSADLENNTKIELVEYDNQIAYEIKGKKKLKLFGLIPVETDTTGYVSAETGDVIGQDEPLITRIFDLLSP